MSKTTEKQATGFVMTSECIFSRPSTSWRVIVKQDDRVVWYGEGCESKQHAEQIARDICVRYALVERPTI